MFTATPQCDPLPYFYLVHIWIDKGWLLTLQNECFVLIPTCCFWELLQLGLRVWWQTAHEHRSQQCQKAYGKEDDIFSVPTCWHLLGHKLVEEKLGDYRKNTKSQKSQGVGEIISNVPSGFCVRDFHKILLGVWKSWWYMFMASKLESLNHALSNFT